MAAILSKRSLVNDIFWVCNKVVYNQSLNKNIYPGEINNESVLVIKGMNGNGFHSPELISYLTLRGRENIITISQTTF